MDADSAMAHSDAIGRAMWAQLTGCVEGGRVPITQTGIRQRDRDWCGTGSL